MVKWGYWRSYEDDDTKGRGQLGLSRHYTWFRRGVLFQFRCGLANPIEFFRPFCRLLVLRHDDAIVHMSCTYS